MDARINMPNSFDGTVKLTKQELGRARFEKLKTLDETGALLHCKTRKDVIELMGLSVKQGQSFVQRAIKTGRLQEILIKKTGRQSEYEYHFVNRKRSRTPAKKLRTFAETWHTQPDTQPTQLPELTAVPTVEKITTGASPRVELEYAGVKLTITLTKE